MTRVELKNLTPRQREAYVLRFRKAWPLRRIATKLGITVSSAGELVKRAQARAGLGKDRVLWISRTKPRRVRARSLSVCEGEV